MNDEVRQQGLDWHDFLWRGVIYHRKIYFARFTSSFDLDWPRLVRFHRTESTATSSLFIGVDGREVALCVVCACVHCQWVLLVESRRDLGTPFILACLLGCLCCGMSLRGVNEKQFSACLCYRQFIFTGFGWFFVIGSGFGVILALCYRFEY